MSRQSAVSATVFLALLGILSGRANGQAAIAAKAMLEPYSFEASDESQVAAERGELWVPENRANPSSRRIKLGFVRFASTNPNPAAPIVYLAGGPGASGVDAARGQRFPIFMALRAIADVIAFDQRGTGWSNDVPRCDTGEAYPLDQPLTLARAVSVMRETTATCVQYWKDAGIDLTGYNTWESAADLDALRESLGAERITLWGISYGTHLGLAAIKRYPTRIEKAVLASIEGLDDTVKLPAHTDAYFARVQAAINANDSVSSRFPDLARVMRRVYDGLDKEPATATITTADGKQAQLKIGKFEVQYLTGLAITDPQDLGLVLDMYEAMSRGDFNTVGQYLYRFIRQDFGRVSRGMPEAMDAASGISAQRLRTVEQQAETALLGDALNFPMPHLAGEFGVADLGDNFRAQPTSDVPTLFLSGTLDGRTYPESAAEIASVFRNGTHLRLENTGHNLLESTPEVAEVIALFLQGADVSDRRIRIPPPAFSRE